MSHRHEQPRVGDCDSPDAAVAARSRWRWRWLAVSHLSLLPFLQGCMFSLGYYFMKRGLIPLLAGPARPQ